MSVKIQHMIDENDIYTKLENGENAKDTIYYDFIEFLKNKHIDLGKFFDAYKEDNHFIYRISMNLLSDREYNEIQKKAINYDKILKILEDDK